MTPTYHIVSHTHWDREWYRSFEEFRSGLISLVDDLLDLVGKDPPFRSFLLDGQAAVVEDYLEIRPDRSGELRRAVSGKTVAHAPHAENIEVSQFAPQSAYVKVQRIHAHFLLPHTSVISCG